MRSETVSQRETVSRKSLKKGLLRRLLEGIPIVHACPSYSKIGLIRKRPAGETETGCATQENATCAIVGVSTIDFLSPRVR